MPSTKNSLTETRNMILRELNKCGENNENGLKYITKSDTRTTRSAIKKFAELELIKFTGGGYFEISEKGKEYLNKLK